MADVVEFVTALVSRWADWLTGGILMALVLVYERAISKSQGIPKKKFAVIVLACFVGATFSVWRDQRDAKIEFQHRLAEKSGPEPIHAEIPAGIANGTNLNDGNPIFTLSTTPSDPSRVRVYEDGLREVPGLHYRIEGRTITFMPGAIPVEGSTVPVEY